MTEQPAPPRYDLLRTTGSRVGDAWVLTVAGEIDLQSARQLQIAISEGFELVAKGGPLVVDLTDVTYLGSTGLAALLDGASESRRRRDPLRIVVDHQRAVTRPIEVTGLEDVLALYRTVEEALRP